MQKAYWSWWKGEVSEEVIGGKSHPVQLTLTVMLVGKND
jgi:hypothetical protein